MNNIHIVVGGALSSSSSIVLAIQEDYLIGFSGDSRREKEFSRKNTVTVVLEELPLPY